MPGSPTITGVMGVSDTPVLNPSGQLGLEPAGVRPQPVDQLRLVLHDLEGRAARRHDGRRMGGREQERPGSLDQDVAQVLAAGDVATEADGLRQGPDLDGNPAVEPEVVDGAPSIPPSTPDAWASSTKTAAPTSSAASTIPGSGRCRRPC